MLILIAVFLLTAATYVFVAYRDYLARRQPGQKYISYVTRTWQRDMTGHEIKIYREMQAHWRREARKTYRKINYDKKISYGTKK